MEITELGMIIDINELQQENARLQIEVMEFDIEIDSNDLQSLKIPSLKDVTESGMVTEPMICIK